MESSRTELDPHDIESIRGVVRNFLARRTSQKQLDQWEHGDGIPRSIITELADLGLCRFTVPEEYGGLGRQVTATLAVVEELGRASLSLAGLYWAHVAFSGLNVAVMGTEEQKARFLPETAAGRLLFSYGLSEPEVGADLANVQMTAVRDGDEVVLNGTKRWSSGADVADYVCALVRSGDVEAKRKNLSFVVIPPHASGVTVTPWPTMGDRGMSHCDVHCQDVRIPFTDVIGGEDGWNRGWDFLTGRALEVEKLGVPAMALGIAGAAVAEAWQYSQERVQFGVPICAHQSVRHDLANAQTKLVTCRLMVERAGELVSAGSPSAVQTSMTKLYVAETAVEIVMICQRVMGAYGLAEGYAMERYMRDVLGLPIVGGSSAIQRNNIATLLKLPRSKQGLK